MDDFGGHALESLKEAGACGGVGLEGWQRVGLEADAEEDTAGPWLGDEGLFDVELYVSTQKSLGSRAPRGWRAFLLALGRYPPPATPDVMLLTSKDGTELARTGTTSAEQAGRWS